MKETKTEINITPTGGQLEIRTGQAEQLEQMKPISIKGDIDAPANYFAQIESEEKFPTSYVTVDTFNHTVVLNVHPHRTHETITVAGSLTLNPLLAKVFNINTDSYTMGKETFIRLLKAHRYAFNQQANMNLVHKLEEFDATIEKTLKDHDNKRGTYHHEVRQIAKTELPESIDITCPVFIGQEEHTFNVEINLEFKENNLYFYLFSPELSEYIGREGGKMITKAIAPFKDKLVVIYV